MHELSIAASLIDVVVGHLIESGGARVSRIVVEVGELSGVVPAALASAFAIARRGEPGLADAVLELRPVPVTIACPNCDAERPALGPAALRCADCGTAATRVLRGREMDVVAMEVFDAAAHA